MPHAPPRAVAEATPLFGAALGDSGAVLVESADARAAGLTSASAVVSHMGGSLGSGPMEWRGVRSGRGSGGARGGSGRLQLCSGDAPGEGARAGRVELRAGSAPRGAGGDLSLSAGSSGAHAAHGGGVSVRSGAGLSGGAGSGNISLATASSVGATSRSGDLSLATGASDGLVGAIDISTGRCAFCFSFFSSSFLI